MPSYGEFIIPPPLSDRPVGNVPPAHEEKPKPQEDDEQPDICARCGKENCKHKR